MTSEEYGKLLHKAAASDFAKLDIPGRTRENDPIYALTISDFSVPDDEKFNLLITGMHVGGDVAIGNAGVKRMVGDLPLNEVHLHDARNFPTADIPGKKNIRAFLERGTERRFSPLLGNIAYQSMPGEADPIKNGVTLQMFLPIGRRYKIAIKLVMVNGIELNPSPEDGYELIRGDDGWHLFLNLPPERTQNENIFHILAEYEVLK